MTEPKDVPPGSVSLSPGQQARQLPIYQHEQQIVDAVRDHSVVIVEGPTGSGKTTQVPRILLRSGIINGRIGLTQPRRIAAVSVARRIAVESDVTLGEEIGYTIRFEDETSSRTQLKVMTDGILLQEARTDPLFNQYGLIMIDEAHERSLNIDLTLGLLHRALAQRDDLKVVVSSATIRPEEFQRFFADVTGNVPLLSVEARTFPIEFRYAPPFSWSFDDIADAVARQVWSVHQADARRDWPGDQKHSGHILAFLSGEALIHRSVEAIERRFKNLPSSKRPVLLPLFGRLTRQEQDRVFEEYAGRRKVIVATNIAETSITIPGVNTVIDSGLAKVPRFNTQTGVPSLFEERISRASAEQRAGRAGRTGPGEVHRLYTETDVDEMQAFTDEEIRRLDLSEVLLRVIDLGIRDLEHFPFLTPPARRKLRAAFYKLRSLGAITEQRDLTAIGRRMVAFPLSPSLARMVVEAADEAPTVVDEVLIVGAFLSARSPFLFLPGLEAEANRAHSQLADDWGDALTCIHTYQKWLAANDADAFCKKNFLDPQIMAFVHKAHRQLAEIAEQQGVSILSGGNPKKVLRCIATGFPDKLLRRRGRHYEGPGDLRIMIHPSSSLYGRKHPYLVSCDIMISRRAYARQVSVIFEDWIRDLNPDLAARWRLGSAKKKRTKRAKTADLPDFVQIGRARLPLDFRGGKPRLEIPLSAVEAVAALDPKNIPQEYRRWSVRVTTPQGVFIPGVNLGQAAEVLKVMPLPEPGSTLARNIPEGVIWQPEWHWDNLARWLPELLSVRLPRQGKRPGWLALVANGLDEYWFEVMPEFRAVVETSLPSLEALADNLPEVDGAEALAESVLARLRAAAKGLL